MNIQILGMGCPKCRSLEANAVEAVKTLGIEAKVEKVADMAEIMKMGVMTTPALAIDNQVRSSGKLLTVEQIMDIVKSAE
jgi:small redox-active disulfide protein 2